MGEDWKNHVSSKHTDTITFILRSNEEIEEYTNRHIDLRKTRLKFYGCIQKWNKLSRRNKKLFRETLSKAKSLTMKWKQYLEAAGINTNV